MNRATLRIDCNLPPEQFAAIASESVPVTLEWRPPLYSDRVAQLGFLFAAFVAAIGFFSQMRVVRQSSIAEALPAAEPAREVVRLRTPEKESQRSGAFMIHPITHEHARVHVEEIPSAAARTAEIAGSSR